MLKSGYTKEELRLLKDNPKLFGTRRRIQKLIQESQQDIESKMEYEEFV